MVSFSRSDEFDALVVVPTIAAGRHLLPATRRLIAHHDDLRVLIVLSFNPVDLEQAAQLKAEIEAFPLPDNVVLYIHEEDGPIGFSAANNRGLLEGIKLANGIPRIVVFHNDDAFVARGWLPGLTNALETERVYVWGEPWNPEDGPSERPSRPVEGYGRIGCVGPVSNLVAGIQQVRPNKPMDPDQVAAWAMGHWPDHVVTADFVSGFCMAFSDEAIRALMLYRGWGGKLYGNGQPPGLTLADLSEENDPTFEPDCVGIFDEDSYPIAGFEDNDVCVRLERVGYRTAIAAGIYVSHLGHQSFDAHFEDMDRGLRNRRHFYQKWAPVTQRDDQKIIGVCRLLFEVPNDFNYFKMAIARIAQTCDGVAILLTGNPLEVRCTHEWLSESRTMRPEDDQMLKDCSGEGPEGVAEVVHAWISEFVATQVGDSARFGADDIKVEVWTKPFNERDERNAAIDLAMTLEPDWVFSFDGDEMIEDRVWRRHIDRLMKHPNPLVRSYDIGWLNHWNSPIQCRQDPPWGDNGTYTGGMHGFRIFRVDNIEHHRRIMAGTENGLHCGNTPDHDLIAKRVGGVRMRHRGYERPQDRQRRYRRYQEQDPNPNVLLVGGETYGHILNDERMIVSPYVKTNGIGAHCLCYEGEKPDDLARQLEVLYSVVDRVVVVWTGEWADEDKAWLAPLTAEQQAAQAQWDEEAAAARERVEAGEMTQEQYDLAAAATPRPRYGLQASRGSAFDPGRWPSTGPSAEMAEMASYFGVEWVHQPLEDDLSKARNAALDVLLPSYREGLGWAYFFDLDEWFDDEYTAAVRIRRMAEVSNLHGWMFQVLNYHEDHPPSTSETIRMARNLPQMRFSGRVHEGYSDSIQLMRTSGIDARFQLATIKILHRGLARDEDAMTEKLRRYQRLLLLELEDNQHNSGAWTSLGLQMFNDGHEDQAIECFERSIACVDGGFLGFRELAMLYLRRAAALHRGAIDRATRAHPWVRSGALDFQKALEQYLPEFPILGSARRGIPTCPPIELPDFEPPSSVVDVAQGSRSLTTASVAELNPEEPEEASGGSAPAVTAEPAPIVTGNEVP